MVVGLKYEIVPEDSEVWMGRRYTSKSGREVVIVAEWPHEVSGEKCVRWKWLDSGNTSWGCRTWFLKRFESCQKV
jgi:hypothetical protein